MADTPAGMKIMFDEQNMTKWEVLMDGPDQSVYAVCVAFLEPSHTYQRHLGRTLQARDHIPHRISLQAAGRELPDQDLPPQRQ